MEEREQRILSFIGSESDDFESYLSTIQQQINQHEKDISFSQAGEVMYTEFIKSSTQDDICPLCERSFDNHKHLANFQKEVKNSNLFL